MKDKDKEKEKEKKSKQRYLSPSFRKGAVKEKKEEDDDDGDFKINLISAEPDDEDKEPKSPSPPKHKKGSKIKEDQKDDKKHQHRGSTHTIPEDMKVNALPEGRVKIVGSLSQAGKGEDGFTKVNQDSFLVLQNEYGLKDFNIFSVMDGHGVNGHLVSRFATKYFTSFFKNNKKMNSSNSNEDAICYRLKKNEYDILLRVVFMFKGFKFIGELLNDGETHPWYIYPYDGEIDDSTIVISDQVRPSKLWQRDIYHININNPVLQKYLSTFRESNIFYATDLVGTDFKQAIDFVINR